MIGYLEGVVRWREAVGSLDELIVLTHGVGYNITCPGGLIDARVGESLNLWIHTITREDGSRLYGFAERNDLRGFIGILSVPGVGAKVALALITALGGSGLHEAISLGDGTSLTQAEGVGKKLAERIIHEMRGKIARFSPPLTNTLTNTSSLPAQTRTAATEAVSALINLGYSSPVAGQAIRGAIRAQPDADLTTLITLGLRLVAAAPESDL